jgi:hypothetical protein
VTIWEIHYEECNGKVSVEPKEGFADMYLLRTGDGGGALYLFRDDALKDHNNQCSHAIEVFEHTVPDDVERLVADYGH